MCVLFLFISAHPWPDLFTFIALLHCLSQHCSAKLRLRLRSAEAAECLPLCLGELPSLSHLSCKLGVACNTSEAAYDGTEYCAASTQRDVTRRTH